MLEIDASTAAVLWRELNFDFAGFGDVRLVSPFGRDLPRDHEPARRLPDQHGPPWTFGAIGFTSVAAAAETRLNDRFLERALADVMTSRPPCVESFGEHLERSLRAGVDGDRFANGDVGRVGYGHHPSSSRCASAAFLNEDRKSTRLNSSHVSESR